MKKNWARYWLIIIPCALVLGVLLGKSGASSKQILCGSITLGVFVIIAAMAINLLYAAHYRRALRSAIVLLEDMQPQAFLDRIEPLYEKTKSAYMRALIAINISAGYADLAQHARALSVLRAHADHPLKGTTKLVYDLNYALCCFYVGEDDAAKEICTRESKAFAAFKTNKNLGGNLAVLSILEQLSSGEHEAAAQGLIVARAAWKSRRLEQEYEQLQARIDAAAAQA